MPTYTTFDLSACGCPCITHFPCVGCPGGIDVPALRLEPRSKTGLAVCLPDVIDLQYTPFFDLLWFRMLPAGGYPSTWCWQYPVPACRPDLFFISAIQAIIGINCVPTGGFNFSYRTSGCDGTLPPQYGGPLTDDTGSYSHTTATYPCDTFDSPGCVSFGVINSTNYGSGASSLELFLCWG